MKLHGIIINHLVMWQSWATCFAMGKQVFTYYKMNCMKGASLRFRKRAAEDKVVKEIIWY